MELLILLIILILIFGSGTVRGLNGLFSIAMVFFFLFILFNIFGLLLFSLPAVFLFLIIYNLATNKFGKTKYYYYDSSSDYRNFYNQNSAYNDIFSNLENNKRYYEALGVTENDSDENIKKSYKDLAREYHPDFHENASDSEKEIYKKKFQKINEAYEKIKSLRGI